MNNYKIICIFLQILCILVKMSCHPNLIINAIVSIVIHCVLHVHCYLKSLNLRDERLWGLIRLQPSIIHLQGWHKWLLLLSLISTFCYGCDKINYFWELCLLVWNTISGHIISILNVSRIDTWPLLKWKQKHGAFRLNLTYVVNAITIMLKLEN